MHNRICHGHLSAWVTFVTPECRTKKKEKHKKDGKTREGKRGNGGEEEQHR